MIYLKFESTNVYSNPIVETTLVSYYSCKL